MESIHRSFVYWGYLVALLVCAGCSSISVDYDFDQEADFQAIHTYGWKSVQVPNDALAANPFLKKRVVNGVNTYMVSRGYAQSDNPDIYLTIHAGLQEKMQVTDWGSPYGYHLYPWPNSWYYRDRVDVHYYTEGKLTIDVIRAADTDLIWRGQGTRIIRQYDSQEKMQRFVDEYVAEILDRFPPGHEKQK